MYENIDFYDNYPRNVAVFAGEYAAHTEKKENNMESALAEAAFLTGVEKNADVVKLALHPIQAIAHLIPVAVQLISGCLEGIIDAIALLAKIVGHGVKFILEIICDLSKIMSHLVQTVDS